MRAGRMEAVRMNILEIGLNQGAREKAAEHIQNMLRKGFSVKEIAELLEEDLTLVEEIARETGITKG